MKIELKTLTPLWTGGVDGRCDRVHETGIIGSLRWWYEALVRGLGGEACDPTDHQCGFDERKFKRPESDEPTAWQQALLQANICDACQAYGATGWARRYRLRVRGGKRTGFSGTLRVTPSRRNRGWFLGPGIGGMIIGTVLPKPQFNPATLIVPLALSSQCGGLGARTQHGYGVAQAKVLEDKEPIRVDQIMLQSLPGGDKTDDQGMPSLRNMFFASVTLETVDTRWWQDVDGLHNLSTRDEGKLTAWLETGSVPVSPAVRNQIRFERGLGLQDAGQENFVFGSTDRVCKMCYQRVQGRDETYNCPMCGRIHKSATLERTKTKIHVSAAYPLDESQWQVRVWGWIPHTLPTSVTLDREVVLQNLHDLFRDKQMWHAALGNRAAFIGLEWREFASARDGKIVKAADAMVFLRSLLIEEDEK